jgi:hypothetical protein
VSPEAKGSHGDWDVVLETSQAYEAEFAALRLREAGLDARVIDQSYRQEPLPSVRSFAVVRVLVPTAAADEARRVLASGGELEEGADLDAGADDEKGNGER